MTSFTGVAMLIFAADVKGKPLHALGLPKAEQHFSSPEICALTSMNAYAMKLLWKI
jgi:hypothetical protein